MEGSGSLAICRAVASSDSNAAVGLEALGQRLQARVLHGQLAKLLRTAVGGWISQQPADLFEAVDHFLQALAYRILHWRYMRLQIQPGNGRGILV